jgi:hypothetical protein
LASRAYNWDAVNQAVLDQYLRLADAQGIAQRV